MATARVGRIASAKAAPPCGHRMVGVFCCATAQNGTARGKGPAAIGHRPGSRACLGLSARGRWDRGSLLHATESGEGFPSEPARGGRGRGRGDAAAGRGTAAGVRGDAPRGRGAARGGRAGAPDERTGADRHRGDPAGPRGAARGGRGDETRPRRPAGRGRTGPGRGGRSPAAARGLPAGRRRATGHPRGDSQGVARDRAPRPRPCDPRPLDRVGRPGQSRHRAGGRGRPGRHDGLGCCAAVVDFPGARLLRRIDPGRASGTAEAGRGRAGCRDEVGPSGVADPGAGPARAPAVSCPRGPAIASRIRRSGPRRRRPSTATSGCPAAWRGSARPC